VHRTSCRVIYGDIDRMDMLTTAITLGGLRLAARRCSATWAFPTRRSRSAASIFPFRVSGQIHCRARYDDVIVIETAVDAAVKAASNSTIAYSGKTVRLCSPKFHQARLCGPVRPGGASAGLYPQADCQLLNPKGSSAREPNDPGYGQDSDPSSPQWAFA